MAKKAKRIPKKYNEKNITVEPNTCQKTTAAMWSVYAYLGK